MRSPLFRTDRNPGQPARLAPLAAALVFVVAAGCGGDSPTSSEPKEVETFSLEAIQGDWEGVGQRPSGTGPTFWIEISITRGSAKKNDLVGSLDEFDSEGGDPMCLLDMLARTSAPPTYTFALVYTFRTDRCGDAEGGVLRLQHDESAGTLTYEWKAPGSSNFIEWATLTPTN